MLVREEIHEVDTTYSIPAMYLKLRCEELKRHKKATLEAWKSRMEARNMRASRAGSLTGRIPSTKFESQEDPVRSSRAFFVLSSFFCFVVAEFRVYRPSTHIKLYVDHSKKYEFLAL